MKLLTTLVTSTLILSSSYAFTAQAYTSDNFSLTLQTVDRTSKDKARDAGRKPAQVMEFFNIKPGMTVLEVLSSGGYYTEILSHRVGNTGKVYAQNNKFILEVLDGRFAKEFAQRTKDNRLENVKHYKKELVDIDLANQVDAVTIVLNYHDMYSAMPKDERMTLLEKLKTALKPGGVLGIIDMEAGSGEHNPKLHRIHHQHVRNELAAAGFILKAEANFLKNSQDDYSKMVFSPEVRGKTDRFVFKFIKPAV